MDTSRPALVLAPHLTYPTRNGADLSLDRIALHLSRHLPYVDLVSERSVTRFVEGEVQERRAYENAMRSKIGAAVRTLVRGSHFLAEKFVTPAFTHEARALLADAAYGTVLYSFIATAALSEYDPHPRTLRLIWTHNDPIKWFEDMRDAPRNPLARRVAQQSLKWYIPFLRRHADDFTFLYVTDADRRGTAETLPAHPSAIVPIGVDLPDVVPRPVPTDGRMRLLFVGSLAQRMNQDALRHFGDRFLPALRERLGERLSVTVAGSNPDGGIEALCTLHGWSLRPNVSDSELRQLYARASYALLPFPYATGAKLKLLGALAHGVPFLATSHVGAQVVDVLPPCLLADEPEAWVAHVERYPFATSRQRDALRSEAARHSWANVAANMVTDLA